MGENLDETPCPVKAGRFRHSEKMEIKKQGRMTLLEAYFIMAKDAPMNNQRQPKLKRKIIRLGLG